MCCSKGNRVCLGGRGAPLSDFTTNLPHPLRIVAGHGGNREPWLCASNAVSIEDRERTSYEHHAKRSNLRALSRCSRQSSEVGVASACKENQSAGFDIDMLTSNRDLHIHVIGPCFYTRNRALHQSWGVSRSQNREQARKTCPVIPFSASGRSAALHLVGLV